MFLAHLSDPHIGETGKPGLSNLSKIVRCLNSMDIDIDAVMVTGDLVYRQRKKYYADCLAELNKLRMPYFAITGNHDCSESLASALREFNPRHPQSELPGCFQYAVDNLPVRLIGLDTYAKGHPNGQLSEERLDWLESKLSGNPRRKPVVVMVHQFTLPTKLTFFDSYPENWFASFNRVIAKHKETVRLVACGHLHNSLSGTIGGVPIVSTFSTNWQTYFDFKPQTYTVAEKLPIGFYLHRFDGAETMSYAAAVPRENAD